VSEVPDEAHISSCENLCLVSPATDMTAPIQGGVVPTRILAALTWADLVRPGRFANGKIRRANAPHGLADATAAEHAKHFVSCFVAPGDLPRLNGGQGTLGETFARFLPRKPHIKSGDYGEILCSLALAARDTPLRFPLYRWRLKLNPDSPVQGVDLIGYVISGSTPTPDDMIVLCEVKTNSSRKRPRLAAQAVTSVRKDFATRLGDQLLFQQAKLLEQGQVDEAAQLDRFRFPHKHAGSFRKHLVAGLVQDPDHWEDDCLDRLPASLSQEAGVTIELALLFIERLKEWFPAIHSAAVTAASAGVPSVPLAPVANSAIS
jgi:hypothetical protein